MQLNSDMMDHKANKVKHVLQHTTHNKRGTLVQMPYSIKCYRFHFEDLNAGNYHLKLTTEPLLTECKSEFKYIR